MGCHAGIQKGKERRAARERAAARRAAPQLATQRCPIHVNNQSLKQSEHTSDPAFPKLGTKRSQVEEYKDQMVAKGWCVHMVEHLSQTYDNRTFSYLASRERPNARQESHDRCTSHDACIAYNTDPAWYETKHIARECDCEDVSVPCEKLGSIIRKGHVPLIAIEDNAEHVGQPVLRLVARRQKCRYVAMSHVWADGLGNPKHNSLPLCQIRRIKDSLEAMLPNLQQTFPDMKGPLLFWMDTLCIPVRAEHESLRLAQIDKMASIYRGAVSCLVLDGELMATEACFDATVNHGSTGLANPPGRASLNLETRARVACSVWMSRSWTLQEACLPPILGIQFSNDVVIMGRHTLTDGRYEERSTKANQSVVSETEPIEPSGTDGAGVTNNDVRFEADVAGNGALPEAECNCVARALESNLFTTFCASGSSFTTAWNELAGRSTSISNDVPLIVTNLLDLNSWELLKHQYEPGEMFLRIMLSLGHLPLSIFFHEGPRQAREKSPHNNWVPAAIGNDLLTPGSHLDIQPSCLLYEHGRREYGGGSDQKDHSIYLIDTLFPLVSTNTICLDKPDLKLNVSVTRADTVYLDTTALTSTLLMIETPDLLKKGDAVRGAYFYYRDEGTGKPRRRWHRLLLALHLRSRHPTKSIDLAFLCPVRLEAIVGDNERFAEINEMYTLRRLDEQIDCRIKYEKPDNFVRLKTRRNRSAFVALLRVVCFLFCLVVWGAIIAGFMYTPVGVFGFFIGGFIAMILAAICDSVLEPYFRRLDKWRYIRTFERIASSRAKRGAV